MVFGFLSLSSSAYFRTLELLPNASKFFVPALCNELGFDLGISVTLRFTGLIILDFGGRSGGFSTLLINSAAAFFIKSGSSSNGITAAISSGSRLSSLGALSLP